MEFQQFSTRTSNSSSRFTRTRFASSRRRPRLRIAMLCALLALIAGPAFAAPAERAPVNINSADAATIAANIKGIGLKRAEQIVAYREQNGAFTDPYELTAIKGIGERVIQNNESLIRLRDF